MSAPRSKSLKDRLKAAKLPERSLQVCLRGDLQAEFDELERQLHAARADTGPAGRRRVGEKSDALAIVEKQNAIREQMAAEMLDIRVRALPRAEWAALIRKYPPQDDHAGDKAMGVNLEGLMAEAIPACVVDPTLDDDDWAALDAVLSSADYDRILSAVWDVNRSGVDVPKSRLASLVTAERELGSN